MLKFILSAIVCLFIVQCSAQNTQVTYYNSKYEEVESRKARYVQTTMQNSDGSVTVKKMDLKKGEETSETYKGEEQYGVWVQETWLLKKGTVYTKLDYDFNLILDSNASCPVNTAIADVKDYMKDDVQIGYKAPLIKGGDLNYYTGKNLRYPNYAKENNIQGQVVAIFTITENGEVNNIIIKEAPHITLAKEYARILRQLKFEKPATLNGKPIEVCVSKPVRFILG